MKYAYYTDVGSRNVNEDTVAVIPVENGFCALVADGLGGEGNGDVASQTAVKAISEAFRRKPSREFKDIQEYFNIANDSVVAINGGMHHTLTTVVGLFFSEHGIAYAHVGDSRMYHFYNGIIAERTYDHSVPQIAVALGEITAEQIRNHPDHNRVLRALGSDPTVEVEIHRIEPQKGFHAFLLCTDGFWEYVYEDEMEIDLAKSETPEQWMKLLCQRRTDRASDDADNNSAIMVFWNNI